MHGVRSPFSEPIMGADRSKEGALGFLDKSPVLRVSKGWSAARSRLKFHPGRADGRCHHGRRIKKEER